VRREHHGSGVNKAALRKNRMRIGFVPNLVESWGGVFQYSLTMLEALDELRLAGSRDELIAFAGRMDHPVARSLVSRGWSVKPLGLVERRRLDTLRRAVGESPLRDAWRLLRRAVSRGRYRNPDLVRFKPEVGRWFRECGVDLMIYPWPSALSFEAGVPYVMAVHDIAHRLHPEFPEVSADGEWEWREYYCRNGIRYATMVLVDSDVSKEDILTCYGPYGITEERVKVLPFLPPPYLSDNDVEHERRRVRTAYALPERYCFYPAQFWPHKNHLRIVEALALIKAERGLEIPLVLCGSHAGDIRQRSFEAVMSAARNGGVERAVRYLGYVPNEDMSGLYAGAAALVMPVLFGPTFIPILEAWATRCPVLTSDIRGTREQVADAALTVDPRSVESIADGIYRLWTDEGLSGVLIERGQDALGGYTTDDFRRRLVGILEEAKMQVRSGSAKQVTVR
jgi:glycosyltransferase involved in cell wall biosynthesis